MASRKASGGQPGCLRVGPTGFVDPRKRAERRSELKDLAGPKVRFIAIAQPELAPYGKATVEVLKAAGLWDAVQPKIVYANNISMAKQLAASGNADAAFTAYSLVLHDKGTVLKIDPHLYHPIEQALAIVDRVTRAWKRRSNFDRSSLVPKAGRSWPIADIWFPNNRIFCPNKPHASAWG